jgi:glutathione peroxidase
MHGMGTPDDLDLFIQNNIIKGEKMNQNSEESFVEHVDNNIYDFPLKSIDGEDGILANLKGKVSILFNVTGECANSPQYTIIQDIYNQYKDLGFEALALPSTDFCQDAYGEFADSNTSAENMKDHMVKLYNTDFPFSEMVNILDPNQDKEAYKRVREEHDKTDIDFRQPKGDMHPLFKELQKNSNVINGNFEKFIVSKDGSKYVRFCNSDLLDLAYSSGNRSTSPEDALANIKKVIEQFLEEEYDENNIN